MIYFAEMVGHDDSPIKIGETSARHPQKRIRSQQTGNPYILEVIATMPGGKNEEQFLHRKFSDWQCPGGNEWFFPNPELDDLIEGIKKGRLEAAQLEDDCD